MSELRTPENDTDFAPAKAIKPVSQWRNKWRASRDHAETVAAEQLALDIHNYGEPQDEYLGPVAVEGDA